MALLDHDEDTICAVATPSGRGGIAVIRVSGSIAYEASRKICPFLPEKAESHKVFYGILKDGIESIDEVLATFFEEGRSFTGEKTVEVSCHGSPIITGQIIQALGKHQVRLARPGEFTYRAFMSGRIDLIQAEAVLGLIESGSQRSSQLSLRQLEGHHSRYLESLEDQLIWILAQCEANIDYSAEDIEIASNNSILSNLLSIQKNIQKMLATYQYGRSLNEGLLVALIGEPNVGKSSLLNAFMGINKAIVTEVAGTTRDIVEGEVWREGYRIRFMDTAGLREATDHVEKIGIERSLEASKKADMTFLVIDALFEKPDAFLKAAIVECASAKKLGIICNKSDLQQWSKKEVSHWIESASKELGFDMSLAPLFLCSAKTSEGLEEVLAFTVQQLMDMEKSGEDAVISNQRHFELLKKADEAVYQGISSTKDGQSPEFLAFELQVALIAIQEVLGKHFDDQVMDRVFKEFCLGK
ncbi:MAG: tRNA uridine-5-carboxymethylaminomethyl(34) synthesis GTPase MnmE [Bdellovibrionales bacterium]|nr:tRNA uridine-5-carboxymethylaminomethyl(34) synthesis GTPase MnmE [Bdellovibrionales bacterium]